MTSKDIVVGPYSYTVTDAMRTFSNLDELWQHHDGMPNVYDTEFESLLVRARNIDTSTPTETTKQLLADIWSYFGNRRTLTTQHIGSVAAVLTSNGGVPKTPVDSATITYSGVTGDKQASRVHHGRPWQALCLYSAEVIENFAAHGHPITYGSTGENITVRGIDWAAVRPGARISIGEVDAVITAYAIPCSQNKAWFLDGDYMLMSHEHGDVSRVYAMVTKPGVITTDDSVLVRSDR